MKANDYIRIYRRERLAGTLDDLDILINLSRLVWSEAKTIIEKRKCRTDAAVLSVFKELDLKWKAICNRVPLSDEELRKYTYAIFRKRVAITLPAVATGLGWKL